MSPWKARDPNTDPKNLLSIVEKMRDYVNGCAARVRDESNILHGTYLAQAAEYEAIAQIIRDRIMDDANTQAVAEALAPPPQFLRRDRQPNPVSTYSELEGSPDEAGLVEVAKPNSGVSGKIASLFGRNLYKERIN